MSVPSPAPTVLQTFRLARLALHLTAGAAVALLLFPVLAARHRERLRQRWSRQLLAVLGIDLVCEGTNPPPHSLIVANHISWVDIFAINALAPAAFISKAEVRTWPLIGWLAARNDTVFLRRGSRGHARAVNHEIATLLTEGARIALFPEGTTTDGSHTLGFHAALMQPAIAAGCPIVPVAIRYQDARGARSAIAAYAGDTTLWRSIRDIAGARGLELKLVGCRPIAAAQADRKRLAHQAHRAICEVLGQEVSAPVLPALEQAA